MRNTDPALGRPRQCRLSPTAQGLVLERQSHTEVPQLETLKIPRSTSLRPVLIHCGDISEAVVQSRFFAHIVPFERLLA